jgi:hypothetical protein
VVDADIGSSISKNPYFKFNVAGAKGDTIELKYKDNKENVKLIQKKTIIQKKI